MQEFFRELGNLERRMVNNYNSNVGHINKLYTHQSKEIQSQQINALKEIAAHSFSKSAAYTNVIIIAGYVAFFTIWNNVKDNLSEKAMLIAALLITLSALIFVIFEVYKMIVSSLYFRKVGNTFKQNRYLLRMIQNIQQQSEKFELQVAKIWIYALIPTLMFGLSAAGILIYCFVINILGKYL